MQDMLNLLCVDHLILMFGGLLMLSLIQFFYCTVIELNPLRVRADHKAIDCYNKLSHGGMESTYDADNVRGVGLSQC